ncbi:MULTISPECIES: hypothetical protein [unclassified Moorena]|uniref:hypothetical protein n=1 Tax=unclassified Moorena TaxID=2683338 RepID=UPI0025D96EC3|nr:MULTISPECIES: hypothetical protein [unclassified Moorena]
MVELASCQFHAYFGAGRMPTLLLFIQRLTQRHNFWGLLIPSCVLAMLIPLLLALE